MANDKCIVIGVDNSDFLSVILGQLHGISGYHFISAGSHSDVVSIVKSVNPSLIVLSFRSVQMIINDLNTSNQTKDVPVLCILDDIGRDSLRWNSKSIVFTESLQYVLKGGNLRARVNSILLLLQRRAVLEENKSFVLDALRNKTMNQSKNLSRYVLELDQKRSMLLRIKDRIKDLYPEVDDQVKGRLISMVNSIKMGITDNSHWDDFKTCFENISPRFLDELSRIHPKLTSKDIKYCCYLKMNMSNEEIRHILGINQESVRTHKYRLKQKMSLPKNLDLQHYIRSISPQKEQMN